jgi:hypothetical protein
MTTLSTSARPKTKTWTVADLYRRFGPIPLERIRQNPPPGCGTVADVDRINNHEDRFYELVDPILVEKTVEFEESRIATKIGRLLGNFVDPQSLGIVAGADGTIKLDLNLVRIPDVSFVSWERLPGGELPRDPIPVLDSRWRGRLAWVLSYRRRAFQNAGTDQWQEGAEEKRPPIR